MFGAFCRSTGATEAIIAPHVDMNIMRKHLSLISKRTQVGRHAVIIVDGAGWQWLRQNNELANRSFEGYEVIVEQCCRAWNSVISDSKRVAILCSRDWIKMGNLLW